MKRKLLLILIPIIILFGMSFAMTGNAVAESAMLTFDVPETAVAGNELTVKVTMNLDGMYVGAYNFDVTYDSSYLEYKECKSMYKPSGADNDIVDLGGNLKVIYYGINASSSVQPGTTVLYELVFNVKKDVEEKNILFSFSDIELANDEAVPIAAKFVSHKSASVFVRSGISTDATLKGITVSAGSLSPSFSSSTLAYTVNVDNNTDKITISGTKNDEKATVSAAIVNAALKVGDNDFSITVTAESGDKKTYTVKVVRAKSSVNTLSGLEVSGAKISPSFSPSTYYYTVDVPYKTTKASVLATASSSTASIVSGTGEKTLSVGDNECKVIVRAENGDEKTYTVNIRRTAASKDATLKSISLSDGSLSPSFSPSVTDYTVTVPNSTTAITITGSANSPLAKSVEQPKENTTLSVGENVMLIKVTSESLEEKTYKITVIREKSSVNTLKNLSVSTGSLSPAFASTKTEYTMTVPYATSKITISAVAADATAKVTGTGEKSLSEGQNKFEIKVSAENGDEKIYNITVTRTYASNDSSLRSAVISDGMFVPPFSPSVTDYTVSVPYKISNVTISLEANDNKNKGISPSATATLQLTAGEPYVYEVLVIAEDNSTTLYTFTITREPASDDATLLFLEPSDGEFDEEFSPEITEYYMSVPYETDKISFDFETNHEEATAEMPGKIYSLSEEEPAVIVITVIAEDESTKDYVINVTREKCTDNTLSFLDLSDGALDPGFSPDIYEYTVDVPYAVGEMSFDFLTSHSTAFATIECPEFLEVGENEYVITVTAQNLEEREYRITVVRGEPSDINTIKILIPSTGKFAEVFSSKKTEYRITVPYTTETMSFSYYLDDDTAMVEIIGDEQLKVGENEYVISVTAENGDVLDYYITVTRTAPSTINTLKMLEPSVFEFDQTFMPSRLAYTMKVPYSTDHIEFSYSATNSFATAELTGNNDLAVGKNEFTIIVTAQNKAERKYVITVERGEPSADSSASKLVPSSGKLVPAFDPEIREYNITVGFKTQSMSFEFEASDEKASVIAEGNEELEVNIPSVFTFEVTAEDGSITVYSVTVLRQEISDNYYLEYIDIENAAIDFSRDIFEYDVMIPFGNETAQISYKTESEEAIVSFEGDIQLSEDEENVFRITVTAENGETAVYTVNITYRAIEEDCNLIVLEDTLGYLNFDPDKTDFVINVPYCVDTLEIRYVLSGLYATSEYEKPEELIVGVYNDYVITVTAENGDEKVYTISVFRAEKSNDSTLSELTVEGIDEELIFDPEKTEYRFTVPYKAPEISVSYLVNDEFATSEAIFPTELVPGKENVYEITVTAEDDTTTAYKIIIFRTPISTDSTLSSFRCSLRGSKPAFSPNVFDYYLTVPYRTDKATVEYEVSSPLATAESESHETLRVGENVFTVTVMAEDMSTSTYTLNITRLPMDTDSKLSRLVPSVGSIAFDPNETEYYIELENSVTEIAFDYKTRSTYAICEADAKRSLAENVPEEFMFTVTAENGMHTVYRVTVLRKPLSDNKKLRKIVIDGKTMDLNEKEICVDVDYTQLSVVAEAFSEDPKATVFVRGGNELVPGKNEIIITVTAEDGSQKDYKVYVQRDPGSSNAYLEYLKVSDYELNEAFDKEKTAYTLTVEPEVSRIAVLAKADDELSSFVISDTSLMEGENVITVEVTSQNKTVLVYELCVTREKETFAHFVTTKNVFRLGNTDINVLTIGIASVLLICGCSVIIVFSIIEKIKKNKKNK